MNMELEPATTEELRAEGVPLQAALAFAPLHKKALGIACGLAGGLLVFGVTVFALVVLDGNDTGLVLLAEYFYGYEVSWAGAFIGFFWGFVTLFVFAWFAAFVRNLILATSVFLARTRAEMRQTRDFLDHI